MITFLKKKELLILFYFLFFWIFWDMGFDFGWVRNGSPLFFWLVAAIVGMREMEIDCRKPALMEFIPPLSTEIEADGGVEMEKDSRDKMKWVSSFQLWSDDSDNQNQTIHVEEVLKISVFF